MTTKEIYPKLSTALSELSTFKMLSWPFLLNKFNLVLTDCSEFDVKKDTWNIDYLTTLL